MAEPAELRSITRRADRLLELVRAAVPFAAGTVAWRSPETGRLQPLATWGYPDKARDFLLRDFVQDDPGFDAVAAEPERVMFWADVPGFASSASARTVLRPLGYGEGTTLVRAEGGAAVGVVHLSLAQDTVPPQARRFLTALRPDLWRLVTDARRTATHPIPTARELDVLALMAEGLTNQQIAHRLALSVSTVGSHVEHLYAKLAVGSRVGAVVRGLRRGLI